MDKVIGRKFFSETLCELGEDGFWTVVNKMGEGRVLDGSEKWEEVYLHATAVDNDFNRAYAMALESVMAEFASKTINRGFTSLFDANDFDKRLEEKKEISNDSKNKSN